MELSMWQTPPTIAFGALPQMAASARLQGTARQASSMAQARKPGSLHLAALRLILQATSMLLIAATLPCA